MKIWTDLSTVLSQYTRVTDRRTGRRTDRRTEFSSLDRVCISCSAVTSGGPHYSLTSLRLVSPGAVTDGVTIIFFLKKRMTYFLLIVFKTDDLFLPSSPTSHTFRLPTHRLFSVLWKFSRTKLLTFISVSPSWWCRKSDAIRHMGAQVSTGKHR